MQTPREFLYICVDIFHGEGMDETRLRRQRFFIVRENDSPATIRPSQNF